MGQKLSNISEVQVVRTKFKPILPEVLKGGVACVSPVKGKPTQSVADQSNVKKFFKNTYGLPIVTFKNGSNLSVKKKKPIKVAIVLSGGQAPGGHNVIAGLFDGLKKANKKNTLIGYLGGPLGILENKYKEINEKVLDEYRNTGGFDYIQSGRTKIEAYEQFCSTKDNLAICHVDALVVVGGDDSNTNAAMIAEYLKQENIDKCVIGIPKTIDGDLKNQYVEISFGFDTATKIYSELVGNICSDANSSRKYWHFVRLMGRSASHIALEVGFKTQPNIVLIGEEILAKKMTLTKVVESIVEVVVKRSKVGKNFGIILIPEGVIEFIPEMKELISAINDVLAENADTVIQLSSTEDKRDFVCGKLPKKLSDLMAGLPSGIASQLILDRDPHGNVAVSLIETEELLIEMIRKRLAELKKEEKYKGKFSTITHFFGYEGRCGIPSNFDANYTYALGYNAAILILNGFTGYMSYVRNLVKHPKQWECGGIPLTMMMNIEKRYGKEKPVIQKALIDLNGNPFKEFLKKRDEWAINENYVSPGPIQYFGPANITEMITRTLRYEHSKR
ncbi:MAG: diphosphate--fructose-6-phosphate 1-phosphotransferase [Endomicrobium sp.]|uniref:diphosphate--fructose-6-phosphate 1-phosphotransferase n=1 Tax=Candidatus Endomicrobiellum pyrsonymphae TaxID=1408203 RepID=UPI0035757E5E|nr:diphosphate--fructose-6-phosphate 1-phosphotransferase [Endomicrobium sp.]